MNSIQRSLAVAGAGVAILVGAWLVFPHDEALREIPYYDPLEAGLKKSTEPGKHYVVSDFKLIDQNGDTITRATFAGKITVVDFFFVNCQGICPIMNTNLKKVYDAYKGNDKIAFISHTVNPENDSVPVLAAHALKYNADVKQWHFVTGEKTEIYRLARKSYLVSDTEGDGSKEDFVHSQNFALVDADGHLRGVYDGTEDKEVERLISDLKILTAH
jgi:protein SCO1/2